MEELILQERKIRENIVQTINDSNLPAFILKPILQDMLEQIEKIEVQQYELALQNKQKQIKESEKKCKK